MQASTWDFNQVNQEQLAKRYINQQAVPDYQLLTYPDGGLYSSCADMSIYLQEMIKGYYGESEVLSAGSFTTMMSNQFDQLPLKSTLIKTAGRSGIFWNIFGVQGVGDIGHSGSDPGVLSFMYFDPITGMGCVLLVNSDEHKQLKQVIQLWETLISHRNDFMSSTSTCPANTIAAYH